MRIFFRILVVCAIILVFANCSTTQQLTISTIEPSPVDFSNQIRKIGIVNNSKSSFNQSYSTRLEQLIAMEERWLAEKGTEAALIGLFDELAKDKRFEMVRILGGLDGRTTDFGTRPSDETWNEIAAICQKNGVDAIFSLASHETETHVSLKKTKMDELGMMRDRKSLAAQEITLETLIENGWRIYYPKHRLLVDEFTSSEEIVASAKGVSPVDAIQSIDNRREMLLGQSKHSGSSYARRMQPQKLDINRKYYVTGTRKFELANDKILEGAYHEASMLWEDEIGNSKPRISGRACYNLAVINEYNGNIDAAMKWATKSYALCKQDATLDYISALENRMAQAEVLKLQLANSFFVEE